MSRFITIAKVGEIPPGEARPADAEGKPIALFNVDGAYYAIDDTCPHKGGPLSEGFLEGHTITCSWHFWDFDIRTGVTSYDPCIQKTYPVRVEGSDIQIDIEA